MWYNGIIKVILKTPLHSLISSGVMLLTYTGHKSGRRYSVPISYNVPRGRVAVDGESAHTLHGTAQETSEVLRAADVLLLPTQREQSLVSMPSKLISYMLAGRPVIAQAVPGSDLAQTIEDADCGWVVQPEDPKILAEAIRKVMALPFEERNRRGLSGRDYALRHFTQATCLPKVINLLEQIVELGEQ